MIGVGDLIWFFVVVCGVWLCCDIFCLIDVFYVELVEMVGLVLLIIDERLVCVWFLVYVIG